MGGEFPHPFSGYPLFVCGEPSDRLRTGLSAQQVIACIIRRQTRYSGGGVCEHIAKWPIYSLITGVNLGSLSPLRGFIHKLAGRNPGMLADSRCIVLPVTHWIPACAGMTMGGSALAHRVYAGSRLSSVLYFFNVHQAHSPA